MSPTRLYTRVRRGARTLKDGPQILALVENRADDLEAAADRGDPPVVAISDELAAEFPKSVQGFPVRQFVGVAVKAVLAERGFRVKATGIRTRNDAVFTTGAVYERTSVDFDDAEVTPEVRDLLGRLVVLFSPAEKEAILKALAE